MATIGPFRALRPGLGSDLAAVTWKPGEGAARDAAGLRSDVAHGRLVRDRTPALYRYEITFGPPDERRNATGFLCRLALDPTPPAADDGDKARAAALCDSEPVVFRYEDERGWVDEVLSSNAFDEVARFTDAAGDEHRLWRIDRPEGVAEAVAQFEDRKLRLERGAALFAAAQAHWTRSGRDTDGAVLALFAPDGPAPAPWRCGLAMSPLDEARPKPWQELAGDPGKPKWRTPPLG